MKEYSILIINNGGHPYYLQNYKTLEECKAQVNNIVSLEKERGRLYFVDNDYFENDYKFCGYENLKYISIKVREVTEWENFSKDNKIKNPNDKNKKVVNILNYF